MNVFVFGSNLAGRHGAGAAKFALHNHGAVYGKGVGLQGESYGIPTKDAKIQSMTLNEIAPYIKEFVDHCIDNSQNVYMLTPIGTGLAGHSKSDILSLIQKCSPLPSNIVFTKEWFNL